MNIEVVYFLRLSLKSNATQRKVRETIRVTKNGATDSLRQNH